MEAVCLNGMYVLELEDGGVKAWVAKSRDVPATKGTWHRRLGHIGNAGLDALISGKHVNGLHVRDGGMDGLCEDCIFGKHARRPFDGVHEVEKEFGERSYLDLWGPAQVTSVGGKRWLFHIVEGCSAAPSAYYLVHKSAEELLTAFKLYKAKVETQTGKKLKIIRVDGGREWIDHLWYDFCGAAVLSKLPLPTLLPRMDPLNAEYVRLSSLGVACCQTPDWRRVCGQRHSMRRLTSNCPRRRAGGKTPYELFHKKKPDVAHLRAYGLTAYCSISIRS
jgi:hypothetical protein